MLDERWGEEAETIGDALRKLLTAECTIAKVRAAETTADGRDKALETHLKDFGLHELEVDTDVLARIAYELGRVIAPTSFVDSAPAMVVLGKPGVSYGFEGPVPADVSQVAVLRNGEVFIEPLKGEPRRTVADDFLVDHQSGGKGERAGDAEQADRMRRLVRLLDAARLTGAGQALLAYAADYAKQREQFGKIIGTYQGVAHRLANAAIALDGAELLVRKASFTALASTGGDGAPTPIFATMVYAKAIDAARLAASTCHQVLGGYGFAMEYDVQLYSRRIRNWSLRRERPSVGLVELARTMLDPAKRDAVRHLWHHDTGVPLPRWARQADKLDRR